MTGVKDQINFLRKLNVAKVINIVKILGSYYLSRLFKTARHKGLPFSISIEPTTACNLKCPECPSGLRSFTRPTGFIHEKTFQSIIDQSHNHLVYLLLYFQGEPFLHPSFSSMVNYATKKGVYTATSTNGHFLNSENAKKVVKSGLDRLIISLDGTDQATYEAYRRGGKIAKVLEGANNIIYWRNKLKSNTPYVIFQFLVVRPNEHQIPEVKQLARSMGIDKVNLKTAQIYDYKNGSDLIPRQEKYSRYRQLSDGSYKIKSKLDNHCWKMWHSCVITWDGQLVPCCFDKDAHHSMGNLQQNSLKSIWNSTEYKSFRNHILSGRDQIEMCKNCTEGTKVFG